MEQPVCYLFSGYSYLVVLVDVLKFILNVYRRVLWAKLYIARFGYI